MLTFEFRPFRLMLMGLSVACFAAISCPAGAFDIKSGVSKESGPFDLFKFGFKAYKNGQKEEAVEAYKYAAEKGHTGSRWALANMYADGDGVPRMISKLSRFTARSRSRASSQAPKTPASSSTRCCRWQATTSTAFPAAR
jgi:hypothetical protein